MRRSATSSDASSAAGAVPRAGVGAWQAWYSDADRLRVGASACLLGDEVRYDGGHKHDRFLTQVLGRWVEWVRVCPEVELGLPVPRPTIRLERRSADERFVVPATGEDLTPAMRAFAERRVDELAPAELDGFVLKRSSPSCGLERVKVYAAGGLAHRAGRGVFSGALVEHDPLLPVEEEGRLHDPRFREHFVLRLFARNRWRRFASGGPARRDLVDFHRVHELLLQVHDEPRYRELGRLVAAFGGEPDDEILARYGELFHRALASPASRGRHVNALQRLLGFLGDRLEAEGKRELLDAMREYARGLLPLVVPLELLRFQLRRARLAYPLEQIYLDPYPRELMLRNET